MRILNVSAQKPDSTGSGTYLAETLRCQLHAGCTVGVICGIDAKDVLPFPPEVYTAPVRFNTPEVPFSVCGMSDEMPYPATRYRDMTTTMVHAFKHAFSLRLSQALHEFEPDVIICHHLYLLTAQVRQLAPDIPVYAICHSTCLRQLKSHALEREFILEEIPKLSGIFSLHDAQKNEIIKLFGCNENKIHVLGTGYNATLFTNPAKTGRETTRSNANAPLTLLYVGKIWKKKGVGCLLEAYDHLKLNGRSCCLKLAGGYNNKGEYEHLHVQAQGCHNPVEFLGRLTPEALAPCYQQAHIFVLPSFFEGLPLVVIEALACGCNVVVSDLPGIRPWLTSCLSDAPVLYVKPPRMHNVDTPYTEDLPGFSQRLACALEQAATLPVYTGNTDHLSWEGLTAKLIQLLTTQ